MSTQFPRYTEESYVRNSQKGLPADSILAAQQIINEVRTDGDKGLNACIQRYEQRSADRLFVPKSELQAAFLSLPSETQSVLERAANRIRQFAEAQKSCLHPLKTQVDGGEAGHFLAPVKRAACYAPGGRFPLPSSVLMTAVTAKVAGVEHVMLVSPSAHKIMLAAAWVADADSFLYAGGAHAVAAAAYGTQTIVPVDIIVGPGNKWVTAAKQLVSGTVAIDMLAGPSELVVLADHTANPAIIAADLLGQAEHDPDAIPILVTCSNALINAVEKELDTQLTKLSTAAIARISLTNGGSILCSTMKKAIQMVNDIGPEHLELQGPEAENSVNALTNYGGLFIGAGAAEVFGDYGVGPNHVLPTSGTSRYTGGLSVFDFIRVRTWLELSDTAGIRTLIDDTVKLAEAEGLSAHAASAAVRRKDQT
ncbi:MAG: histidinol dehydrogenase [Myxococcota bacterium]